MNLFLTLLLVFTAMMSSCNVIERIACKQGNGTISESDFNNTNFDGVIFDLAGNVYINKSDTFSIKVFTDENLQKNIKMSQSSNILKIHSDESICPTSIKIYLNIPSMSYLKLDGSGSIICTSGFNGENLKVYLDGSGDIILDNLNYQNIINEIDGSGDIKISGIATFISNHINGSGNIKSFELQSKNGEASVDGSGNIEISSTDNLRAQIDGSGNIYYLGSPNVSTKINGSGSISKKQ